MANGITVRVRSYQRYKGRGDVKHNSWFRLSNRLLEDPDFYEFSHEELLVWVQILSLCSQKDSDTIFLNFAHLDRVCRLRKDAVLSAVTKLTDSQIDVIEEPARTAHVTSTVRARTVRDTSTVRARYADDTFTCATGQDSTDKTGQDTRDSARAPRPFEAVLAGIHPVIRERWARRFPAEEGWLERQLDDAYAYHTADPAKAPRTEGLWTKRFTTWLINAWERRRSQPGQAKADLSGIQFDEEAP